MTRKSKLGNCRICGRHAKLSFEHVPPESAFNNHRVVGKHIFELINKDPDDYFDGKGHISQRGAGAYTLCEKCNPNTGAWYGDAFANFARQSLDILKHVNGQPSLYYPFHIYPLRVIKQIITMFFSVTILWTISICFMLCFQVLTDFSLSFGQERNSQKKNFRCKSEQPQRGGMSIGTL